MSDRSSTFRALLDSTKRSQGDKGEESSHSLQQHLAELGHSTLASAVQAWPDMVSDRSLFFDLVQKDYREQQDWGLSGTPEQYCEQFNSLNSDLLRSIHRLVEVERFFAGNPDLLNLVDEPEWPDIGQVFDGFLIEEELGRGALSKVFLCQQLAIGKRRVVLKMTTVARHEAWVLGKLDHPNIMPIHSVGVSEAHSGLNWICMPYLGKATLQSAIENSWKNGKPQSSKAIFATAIMEPTQADKSIGFPEETFTDRILQIALKLADALAYVHQQGVLHGDLKPSNVLLTPEGKPLLIDFNLSSDEASNIALLGGTLPYMAPEQLAAIENGGNNQPGPSTIMTEVFGLGRLILHALTGEEATPQHSFTKIENVAQAILEDRRHSLPKAIKKIAAIEPATAGLLEACVADDPGKRPASLEQVRDELKAIVQARCPAPPESKKQPRLLAIVSGFVVLSMLAAWQIDRRGNHPDRLIRKAQQSIESGQQEKAMAIYSRLVTEYPAEHLYAKKWAASLLDMRDYRQAAETYMQAARQFGKPLDYAMSGYCLNLAGEHAQAIICYVSAEETGTTSAAIRGNLAASRRNQLSKHFDQKISELVEVGLTSALKMDPGNEVIRFQMLTHFYLAISEDSRDLPAYPVSIVSPLANRAGKEFFQHAASFLVLTEAPQGELETLGLKYIRLLAAAQGDNLEEGLRERVFQTYKALPGFKTAITPPFPHYTLRQKVYYLDPRNYKLQSDL